MKKLLLFLLLTFSLNSFSQIFVNDVNINKQALYIRAYFVNNNKNKLYIDYGQKPNYKQKQVIKNSDGMTFFASGSHTAVINFITSNGYTFIQAVAVQPPSISLGQNVMYIFKRMD